MFNQPRVNWQPIRPVPVEQHSQSATRTSTGLRRTQAGIAGLNAMDSDHDDKLSSNCECKWSTKFHKLFDENASKVESSNLFQQAFLNPTRPKSPFLPVGG
jgi:hypothetical protein